LGNGALLDRPDELIDHFPNSGADGRVYFNPADLHHRLRAT
jgi:hypothetical protein